MSQVLFYALGGLQEDGKNLYCVEVDKKIFILDAGSKVPPSDLRGVDIIVPNINHLIANKDRIVGLFLTHAHDEHIGSVYQIIKYINCKVYASNFTMVVLKDKLEKEGITYNPQNLITVRSRSTLEFDDIKVRFFELAHNLPDCCGIDIQTIDGETTVYIPQGIKSGELIRIPNKGYQNGKGGRGDLVAEIKVMVPDELSAEEVKIFEKLKKISKFNPRN